MYDKINLRNINKRIKQPSSPFFKSAARGFNSIFAAGTVILGLTALPVSVPATLVMAASYMIAVGVTGSMLCKLTVDPEKTYDELMNKNNTNHEN